MSKLDEYIGFIGGGNMAFAIGSGMINRGIVKPTQVFASGPNIDNLQKWRDLGAKTTDINGEIVAASDIIFICVKPHMLNTVAKQVSSDLKTNPSNLRDQMMFHDQIYISVLAGVTLDQLEKAFHFINDLKMVRAMPNTPIQIGEGCTVYSPGSYVTHQSLERVHFILNSLGVAKQVPEKMINSVGALSGCGPAFVYTIIEGLADGAVKQGVPRQMALQFAAQTILGAAKTVLLTDKHPAILRDEVCSPGGSTICGVHELEKGGVRNALINAIEKAAERSAELGNNQ